MREHTPEGITRRQALTVAVGGTAAVALAASSTAGSSGGTTGTSVPPALSAHGHPRTVGTSRRLPVVFLPHGGGPWPFVDLGFSDAHETAALTDYLRSIPGVAPVRPNALLVISAHWEEAVPTVTTGERPPLLFDYYGFPPESYQLTWPAPGDPRLAARVRGLLSSQGFTTAEDPHRGYDHGTFVPLKVAWPGAEIPVVQLSLVRGLDPEVHLAMGRALAPLRDEGVFILGSGMTYHNMRGFGGRGGAREASERFDAWLRETGTMEAALRDRRLADWSHAPSAREAHPREEHLLPMMVIAGAAGSDRGRVAYNGTFANVRLSAYHYG